jgi:hypothetical protein
MTITTTITTNIMIMVVLAILGFHLHHLHCTASCAAGNDAVVNTLGKSLPATQFSLPHIWQVRVCVRAVDKGADEVLNSCYFAPCMVLLVLPLFNRRQSSSL